MQAMAPNNHRTEAARNKWRRGKATHSSHTIARPTNMYITPKMCKTIAPSARSSSVNASGG